MIPLRIPYESEDFPAGRLPRGTELTVTWDDILWAAITVGRPNRQYVFKHGSSSLWEALFRWSLVRMSLEQASPSGYRLRRTAAAATLDPSEKGAVNYFLGLVVCKLFAAKLLNTPWLLHLDVFRPMLDAQLKGRSRPDLVGNENGSAHWHAFECKGRISPPAQLAKDKAKQQACRLVSVQGRSCTLHIGAITYFRKNVVQFYWCDPEPVIGSAVAVPLTDRAWMHYYAPAAALVRGEPETFAGSDYRLLLSSLRSADVEVVVHPLIADPLLHGAWAEARRAAISNVRQLAVDGFQPDGLSVRAGASWHQPFEDLA